MDVRGTKIEIPGCMPEKLNNSAIMRNMPYDLAFHSSIIGQRELKKIHLLGDLRRKEREVKKGFQNIWSITTAYVVRQINLCHSIKDRLLRNINGTD